MKKGNPNDFRENCGCQRLIKAIDRYIEKADNDLSKTLSIHIGLYAREFQVALIGPYHSYDLDCAVLQDDILTVLQDNMRYICFYFKQRTIYNT